MEGENLSTVASTLVRREDKSMSRFLFVLLLSMLSLTMLTARPINAQTWNLATDFSATNNPNGVWSYGAKEATLSADLILYTDTTAIPAHYGTQQLAGWTNPATGIIPYVAKNTSAQDWNYDGTSEGGGPAVLHPQEVTASLFLRK